MHGGSIVARALKEENVQFLFTLIGGHISPIVVGAKQADIRVIDVRHEADAVFAADAVARLTGIPGVAAVTAGPGITNTITATKNAYLAQSPVIILGGAAPTLLKGRGALQDIDQMKVMKPNVKWATAVRTVRDIYLTLKEAFRIAREGVPGPVFVELPLDVLYDESVVRAGFEKSLRPPANLAQRMVGWYVRRHLDNVFRSGNVGEGKETTHRVPKVNPHKVRKAQERLLASERPVVLVGSGAMMVPGNTDAIVQSLNALGMPVYLSGMARGLLGKQSLIQYRHHRKETLREADLIILAGVPCDFRLEYGQQISAKAKIISINRSRSDLFKNRRPDLPVLGDPGAFLMEWGKTAGDRNSSQWSPWKEQLAAREADRERNIHDTGLGATGIHPVQLFLKLESLLADHSVIIADGGDFVGTASYILKPRRPLSWLDPGVFGTLGVGGGFALGAHLCIPESEVVLLYGDGSAGYSLMEFDTMVRHGLPAIAIIGNDASWAQIARDQVDILKDDVGTVLSHSNYEKVAEAFGANGRMVRTLPEFEAAFQAAREAVSRGLPFLINVILEKSDFRKGSLSM